ncbi:MAG: CRISPR-associated protein Cas5 [bacterium]|nr:CRISPR-associated protein Cas5 [bacterium]
MQKKYRVELEISGRAGLYARPDTGGTPISYPVPTYSACKATLECIAFLRDGEAWFRPIEVAVCRRVARGDMPSRPSLRHLQYTTNYGGPLRKSNQIAGDNNFQLIAMALAEPCFRISAIVEGKPASKGRNQRHFLKDLFERRLRQGRAWRTPNLGWSEFTADYWGEFREGETDSKGNVRSVQTEVDQSISMNIPTMLHSMWDKDIAGRPSPRFIQDADIHRGVLKFPSITHPEATKV